MELTRIVPGTLIELPDAHHPGRRGELTIGHLGPVVEDRPATVLSEHIAAARVIARYELPGPVPVPWVHPMRGPISRQQHKSPAGAGPL